MTAVNRTLQLSRINIMPTTLIEMQVWARQVTDIINSAASHLRVAGTSVASFAVTGDPVIEVAGGDPKIVTWGVKAATDEKVWDHVWGGPTGGSGLLFRTRNDADNDGRTWLSVQRSGMTVTSVTLARLATSASTINIAEAGAQGGLAGNAAGTAGDIAWGSSSNVSYLYVCVSTNSWMRAALSPF